MIMKISWESNNVEHICLFFNLFICRGGLNTFTSTFMLKNNFKLPPTKSAEFIRSCGFPAVFTHNPLHLNEICLNCFQDGVTQELMCFTFSLSTGSHCSNGLSFIVRVSAFPVS